MFSITIDRDNPDNVWVSTCGWVYNTPNRGDNWTRYRDGFNNRRIHDIELDPCDPRLDLRRLGRRALSQPTTAARRWYTYQRRVARRQHDRAPSAAARTASILGVEGDGVYVSNDDAKTFTRTCDGLRNLTHHLDRRRRRRSRRTSTRRSSSAARRAASIAPTDAGATWKKLADERPAAGALARHHASDAEVKFVAGTEKGFFWSSDGEEWTQAPPASYPIRVDKVLRFNKVALLRRDRRRASSPAATPARAGIAWPAPTTAPSTSPSATSARSARSSR